MLENDTSGTEEANYSFHCVQDSQKDERKKPETFRQLCFRSIWRRAPVCWITWKIKTNNPHFFWLENFHCYPVFNKQNDQVVTFGNLHRRVATTNPPASIMMLAAVASNGEKIPPVLFARDYRLCHLQRRFVIKFLPWIKKIPHKPD